MTYSDNNGNEFIADDLLLCPFCGNKPDLIFIGNNHTKSRKVTVKCNKCRIQRTDAALRNEHEQVARWAIEHWNDRSPSKQIQEFDISQGLLKDLTKVVDELMKENKKLKKNEEEKKDF